MVLYASRNFPFHFMFVSVFLFVCTCIGLSDIESHCGGEYLHYLEMEQTVSEVAHSPIPFPATIQHDPASTS